MKQLFVAMVVAGSLAATSASAAPLAGSFDLASLGNVQVGPDFIDWGEVGPVFGPTDGDVIFTNGTGAYAPGSLFYPLPGTLGGLKDLNLLTAPVNTAISIENFLTSVAHPELDFTLTFLAAGTGTGAGCGDVEGSVCTPFPGSPFTITNGQALPNGQIGSGVTVNMAGTVTDGEDSAIWSAAFTTQFATMSSGEILAMIDDEGFVESSYSAQFVVDIEDTPVPEPASMVLMGLALSGMAMAIRRRRA